MILFLHDFQFLSFSSLPTPFGTFSLEGSAWLRFLSSTNWPVELLDFEVLMSTFIPWEVWRVFTWMFLSGAFAKLH